jgi:hypothetical protein
VGSSATCLARCRALGGATHRPSGGADIPASALDGAASCQRQHCEGKSNLRPSPNEVRHVGFPITGWLPITGKPRNASEAKKIACGSIPFRGGSCDRAKVSGVDHDLKAEFSEEASFLHGPSWMSLIRLLLRLRGFLAWSWWLSQGLYWLMGCCSSAHPTRRSGTSPMAPTCMTASSAGGAACALSTGGPTGCAATACASISRDVPGQGGARQPLP